MRFHGFSASPQFNIPITILTFGTFGYSVCVVWSKPGVLLEDSEWVTLVAGVSDDKSAELVNPVVAAEDEEPGGSAVLDIVFTATMKEN